MRLNYGTGGLLADYGRNGLWLKYMPLFGITILWYIANNVIWL